MSKTETIEIRIFQIFRIFGKLLLVTARGLLGEYNSVDLVEKFQKRKKLLSKTETIEIRIFQIFRIFEKLLLVTARGLLGEYNSVDLVEKY